MEVIVWKCRKVNSSISSTSQWDWLDRSKCLWKNKFSSGCIRLCNSIFYSFFLSYFVSSKPRRPQGLIAWFFFLCNRPGYCGCDRFYRPTHVSDNSRSVRDNARFLFQVIRSRCRPQNFGFPDTQDHGRHWYPASRRTLSDFLLCLVQWAEETAAAG